MKKTSTAQAALVLCDKHQNEDIDLYCKPCKTPICSKCVRTDHVGHEFETIATWSRKLINNKDEYLKGLRSIFAGKKKHKDRIVRETKCRNENLLKQKLNSLDKRQEVMKQAVAKLIDKQKAECQSYSDKLSIDVQNLERKTEKEETEIKKILDIFERTTTKGLDIIEFYQKLCSRVSDFEVPSFSEQNEQYVYQEGNINSDRLREMIGSVNEISSVPNVFGKTSTFLHKEVRLNTIRPITNDNAWITYEGEKEFALMNRTGKCFQLVNKNTDDHCFFVSKEENIFIHLDFDRKIVLKIDNSGKTSVIMKTAPLRPFQVGEALDGNILVSLIDEFSFIRTAQSNRNVQMVIPGGQVLHTYEFGEDGFTPMLTIPCALTQNYKSNVCMINQYQIHEGKHRGKVIVFHEKGELKFIYKGHSDEFQPFGICCNSLCNLICNNYRDDSVHIIDSEGTFLAYLLTRDVCIADAMSLGLHSDALWVGSGSGRVAVYRYKY